MSNIKKRSGQKTIRKLTRLSKKWRSGSEEHLRENLVEKLPSIANIKLLVFEWSLLIVALILVAVIQSIWSTNTYSTPTFVKGGTYTEATIGKVNSLNPLFATTNSEKELARLMYATLTTTDYSGNVGMGIAESITSDERGRTWTVVLKKGLKWSDGEPITSKDVLYTVQLIQNPSTNTIYTSNLSGVKVSEEGEKLVFQLASAYADFPSALEIPIVPEHILSKTDPSKLLESSFSTTNPITSGAFTYNATQNVNNESNSDEKIIYLAANENYIKKRPLLDSFAVHTYNNMNEVVTALNTGVVTATAELLPTDKQFLTSNNILEQKTQINSGVFAFLNMNSEFLRSYDLRKAIQIGVNLDAVRAELDGEKDLNYPILQSQLDGVEFPPLPEKDVETAKTLVQQANLKHDIPLRIATVSTGYFPRMAEVFADQLKKIGFTAEVSIYEPGQEFLFNVIRTRNYDILLYEIQLGINPDLFAYYHSSQAVGAGLNLANYRNSLADDLILAARSSTNKDLKVAKYTAFLKHWINDVPAIGIYQTELSYFYNKNAKTFSKNNRLIVPMDRFVDVNEWAVEKTNRNLTP